MIQEVVSKLVTDLDKVFSDKDLGEPFLSSHSYRTFPFDKNNFKPIKQVKSDRKIAFVDGGNQELIRAPNFSIQLNRVYFNIFDGLKRINELDIPQRIEFFSFTIASFQEKEIFFNTSLFPVIEKFDQYLPDSTDLSFKSTDRRVMNGISRAHIDRVASISRKFAEWSFAQHIIENELDKGDILVLDGSLRTVFKNEAKYAEKAYESAKKRKVVFSGLSKTSTLFTTTGLSLLGAVRKLAVDNGYNSVWYYYPIAESINPEHDAEIFVVKLNERAKRVFRYEIQAVQVKELGDEKLGEVFSSLSLNSCDISFPGYPYGLIDADDRARVRHEEVEMYKMLLLTEISKRGVHLKFNRHMESTDAHDVLNMLKGDG
jgi:hypothetical protein